MVNQVVINAQETYVYSSSNSVNNILCFPCEVAYTTWIDPICVFKHRNDDSKPWEVAERYLELATERTGRHHVMSDNGCRHRGVDDTVTLTLPTPMCRSESESEYGLLQVPQSIESERGSPDILASSYLSMCVVIDDRAYQIFSRLP